MLKPYNEASLQPALRATSADLILHQWSRHRQGTKLHSRRRCNVNQNTIDWTKSSRRKMKMGFTLRPPQLPSAKRQAWSQKKPRVSDRRKKSRRSKSLEKLSNEFGFGLQAKLLNCMFKSKMSQRRYLAKLIERGVRRTRLDKIACWLIFFCLNGSPLLFG